MLEYFIEGELLGVILQGHEESQWLRQDRFGMAVGLPLRGRGRTETGEDA